MIYIVNVSGGLASFEALRRAIEQKGRENVVGLFADVGEAHDENGVRVCGEDEDLYRFLDETEALLDFPIIRLRNERYKNIWDVFFAERMLGSTLRDPCSRHLKRRVLDDYIKANFWEFNAVRCLGFSWLEKDRAAEFDKWAGYWKSWHPLLEPPYVTSDEIAEWLEAQGIRRPRLYTLGFSHNNCGGFCVKMGLGQVFDFWRFMPLAYRWNENQELRFRREINPNVTIFRRREQPVTMRDLRLAFEAGYVPRTAQRSCGGRCMIPDLSETRHLQSAITL